MTGVMIHIYPRSIDDTAMNQAGRLKDSFPLDSILPPYCLPATDNSLSTAPTQLLRPIHESLEGKSVYTSDLYDKYNGESKDHKGQPGRVRLIYPNDLHPSIALSHVAIPHQSRE